MSTINRRCPSNQIVTQMDFAVDSTTSTLVPVGLMCANVSDVQAGSSNISSFRWDQTAADMSIRCLQDNEAAYGLQAATGGGGGITAVNMLCRNLVTGAVRGTNGPVRVNGTNDAFGRMYTVDRDSDTAALGGIPAAIDGLAVTGSSPVTGLRATASYGGTSAQLNPQYIPPPIQNVPLTQRLEHEFHVRLPAVLNSVAQQAVDISPSFAMSVTALVLMFLIVGVILGPKLFKMMKR